MHIGEILTSDCANGIGVRLTMFVSGCTIHCKGCFNAMTWDFEYGNPYDRQTEEFILTELKKPQYRGLTILGGEPFEPSNQTVLVTLIRRVRKECLDRDIWMYSGFHYDQDLVPGGKRYTDVTDEILDNIDVLVDGPFVQEKRNLMLRFRGSENQRILDMRKTRETGQVTLAQWN